MMKANTSKKRTHSLLNQWLCCFARLPVLREERARALVQKLDELIRQQAPLPEMFMMGHRAMPVDRRSIEQWNLLEHAWAILAAAVTRTLEQGARRRDLETGEASDRVADSSLRGFASEGRK